MQLIDTHAHVYANAFQDDLEAIIQNSLDNNVHKIYMPNIDMATLPTMLAIAQQYPKMCFPMIGIHPCDIKQDYKEQLYQMERWLTKQPFVAVGEIGIDLYHDTTYQAAQKKAFITQIGWAKTHSLPIVIHCRNAFKEVLEVLEQHQDGKLRGILHCFSGTLSEAKKLIELGFYLGIGGIVTMKNSGLDRVVEDIDLKHIVLETDSPYLAPHPYRGKRNEPGYLLYIAEKIATIKNVPLAAVAKITTANAEKVFHGNA